MVSKYKAKRYVLWNTFKVQGKTLCTLKCFQSTRQTLCNLKYFQSTRQHAMYFEILSKYKARCYVLWKHFKVHSVLPYTLKYFQITMQNAMYFESISKNITFCYQRKLIHMEDLIAQAHLLVMLSPITMEVTPRDKSLKNMTSWGRLPSHCLLDMLEHILGHLLWRVVMLLRRITPSRIKDNKIVKCSKWASLRR